jgi:hypothetical protein
MPVRITNILAAIAGLVALCAAPTTTHAQTIGGTCSPNGQTITIGSCATTPCNPTQTLICNSGTWALAEQISNNGNVGIWTASPANALDVGGSLAVGSYAGTASGASNELIVGGSVGIGTTTPGSSLEVYKSAVSALGPVLTINNPAGGGGSGAIEFTNWSGASQPISAQLQVSDNNYGAEIVFLNKAQTSGGALSEKLRITATGNIGIASSAPRGILDIYVSNPTVLFGGTGDDTGTNTLLFSHHTNGGYQKNAIITSATGSYGRANMYFALNNVADSSNASSSNAVMTLVPAGNVGIGTTNPQATLHVNGGVIVANDTASCSSTNAGELKYTSANLYFCNGTAWTTVGTTSAPNTGCGQTGSFKGNQSQTVTVTAGCTVVFKAWGAGGGSGQVGGSNVGVYSGAGGGGGYASITLGPLGSTTTYYLEVGGGGAAGATATGGAGQTSFTGGSGSGAYCVYGGGGGGGASGVWTGSYGGTPVIVAAGGGGGSGGSACSTSWGWNAAAGGVGSQTTGTNGANSSGGGGGGAGYSTGGAAGTASGSGSSTTTSGGNGGTCYAASGGGTSSGSGTAPPNVSDSNYVSPYGYGGTAVYTCNGCNDNGNNGNDGMIYYTTY